MTVVLTVILFIGGIAVSIMGYFLKKTMDDVDKTKELATYTRERLSVLENDHNNKHASMTEKFDSLKESMDMLTGEIKHLISKIKN